MGNKFKSAEDKRLYGKLVAEARVGARELFDTLNPVEKKHVLAMLDDFILNGDVQAHSFSNLWEIDYIRKPVGVIEFIESKDYLGHTCNELYDCWKRDLEEVLRPGSTIVEWILSGSIGCGKTTTAAAAQAYKVYCLSCMRNPAKYYGLLSGSKIVFGVYSLTKTQANEAGYYKLRDYIDSSPYFNTHFPRNQRMQAMIQFRKHAVSILSGSRSMHALGMDLFSMMLDEANFMHEKADKATGEIIGQAYELYNSVQARVVSRFARAGGSIPGLLCFMSSKKAQSSFLEEHLKKVTKNAYRDGVCGKVGPNTYVSSYALWEAKKKLSCPKKFRVEVGDRTANSRILGADEVARPGARVVQVPDIAEFRRQFGTDVDQSLRDLAGVATLNVSPLIWDRDSIQEAHKGKGLIHPFTRDILTLSTKGDWFIENFYRLKDVCSVQNSKWVPRLNPRSPRYIHTDIGLKSDAAGMCMGHFSGFSRVQVNRPDGTRSLVSKPHIIIDFMLRIIPPPGGEIDLSKLRSFIFYLRDLYTIHLVTYDGFASEDSVQLLTKEKINSKVLSVDRTDAPYLALRAAYSERRISQPYYKPFEDEVLDLQRDIKTGKVDHPQIASVGGPGRKDVADGAAGVISSITEDDTTNMLPILEGGDEVQENAGGKIVVPTSIVVPSGVYKSNGKKLDWAELERNLTRGG